VVLGMHPGTPPKSLNRRKMGKSRWYKIYLKSVAWQNKRKAAFEHHGKYCFKCGTLACDIHHLTYENVGYEPLDDIVPLCRQCHEAVHGIHR
jgi:5-methylcytosine-specific restriction endonuclease McrA